MRYKKLQANYRPDKNRFHFTDEEVGMLRSFAGCHLHESGYQPSDKNPEDTFATEFLNVTESANSS